MATRSKEGKCAELLAAVKPDWQLLLKLLSTRPGVSARARGNQHAWLRRTERVE
jgi:hypothetical protein